MMHYKVAQIIPYFGRWPEWIELYLYSCGRNPMVDFIFYTDCPQPQHVYPNTMFVHLSFGEYCQLVGQRLGMEYRIPSPYKLTDLKPFMGLVHEPEFRDYDFWSFGDLDLVYGNLGMMVNDRNLARYDLLTTHSYHIAGHLTLCRNNDYFRTLCLQLDNWQERLCDARHYAFDEGEWSDRVYPRLTWLRRFFKYCIRPFTNKEMQFLSWANHYVGGKMMFTEYYTSPAPRDGQKWTYDMASGRMIAPTGLELPYLHFLFFKKTPWLETDTYWRDGYWALDEGVEKYGRITFTNTGVHELVY